MAKTICPPGEWTTIPDTGGAMLVEARGMGFYLAVGTPPTNPSDGMTVHGNEQKVISAGLAVAVQPAQPVKSVMVISSLI